jgi:hypothetical protein
MIAWVLEFFSPMMLVIKSRELVALIQVMSVERQRGMASFPMALHGSKIKCISSVGPYPPTHLKLL